MSIIISFTFLEGGSGESLVSRVWWRGVESRRKVMVQPKKGKRRITIEKELTLIHGPIGRDILPQFNFWAKRETIEEQVVRTTPERFVGGHLRPKDHWEAFCAERGK